MRPRASGPFAVFPTSFAFVASLAFVTFFASLVPAHAAVDERGYLLTLDGASSGFVRAATSGEGAKKTLTITTETPTPVLLGGIRGFFDGKSSKRSVVLATSAVVQKANDARLVGVRLPSYAGNGSDVALTFEVPTSSTSPSLRAVNDRAVPSGVKLASFRLALGELPTKEATRLDAVAFRSKEGSAIPGAFVFDVPSVSAPAFLAWTNKPAALRGSIEYITTMGEAALAVKLVGCTPSSVRLDGPVTHVTATCARAL